MNRRQLDQLTYFTTTVHSTNKAITHEIAIPEVSL